MAKGKAAPKAKAVPNAGGGSKKVKCRYCGEMSYSTHHLACKQRPYEDWRQWIKTELEKKYTLAEREAWRFQCQHCAMRFPRDTSKRTHLSTCEERRQAAGLPLNQFPVLVPQNSRKEATASVLSTVGEPR